MMCVVVQEKSRDLLIQKERGYLGPRGCTHILETSSKGSNVSQPVLFVLLTPVSAQPLQPGKPSCTLALSLFWQHTPGSSSCCFPEHLQNRNLRYGWALAHSLWGSEQGKALFRVRVDYCWLIPIRAALQGPQCHRS